MTGYMGKGAQKVKDALMRGASGVTYGASAVKSAFSYRPEIGAIRGIASQVSGTVEALKAAYDKTRKDADGYSRDANWVFGHSVRSREARDPLHAREQEAVAKNLREQAGGFYKEADSFRDARSSVGIVASSLKELQKQIPGVHDIKSAAVVIGAVQSARENAGRLAQLPNQHLAGQYSRVSVELAGVERDLMVKFGKRFGLTDHYLKTH